MFKGKKKDDKKKDQDEDKDEEELVKKADKKGLWELAIHMIIRPQRAVYSIEQLGPAVFTVAGRDFVREDLQIKNKRGLTLQCSWYRPITDQAVPAVIYLHGNSGCRADADDALHTALPYGCSVFTFDFSGSGQSEGEFVSLGYFEKDDVGAVVAHLRSSNRTSTIALWGRSMGAATALLYAKEDPSIAGMVVDSPFSDLAVLCEEVVALSQMKIPKPVIKMGMALMKKGIQKRAHFDITDCAPIKYVDSCFVPVLFVHGERDDFIVPRHSQDLCDKYAGEKNRILVQGGHNTIRPSFMRDSASIFLAQCFSLNVISGADANVSIPVGLNRVEEDQRAAVLDAATEEEEMMARAIAMSLMEQEQREQAGGGGGGGGGPAL